MGTLLAVMNIAGASLVVASNKVYGAFEGLSWALSFGAAVVLLNMLVKRTYYYQRDLERRNLKYHIGTGLLWVLALVLTSGPGSMSNPSLTFLIVSGLFAFLNILYSGVIVYCTTVAG